MLATALATSAVNVVTASLILSVVVSIIFRSSRTIFALSASRAVAIASSPTAASYVACKSTLSTVKASASTCLAALI